MSPECSSERSSFVEVCVACPLAQKCNFFQDIEGLTEVLGRMSAGISSPRLPLWADFSFLRHFGVDLMFALESHV